MIKIEIILLANNAVFPWQNLQKTEGLKYIELNKLFATQSIAEHGLGFLINIWEVKGKEDTSNNKLLKKIIFDTGSTNLSFLHNLDVRGYPLYDVDTIVLSHWHYDHTGGLYKILERIENQVDIISHHYANFERIFKRSRKIQNQDLIGKTRKDIIPLLQSSKIVNQEPINLDKIDYLNGNVIFSKEQIEIFKKDDLRILVSGEIPRRNKEEDFNNFLFLHSGLISLDKIWDDKCIIIEHSGKIIILNGCCHSGIINTLNYVKTLTTKPFSHIIGGFHMIGASIDRIKRTLGYFRDLQIDKIDLFPIHCSGQNFIDVIKKAKIPGIRAFNISVGTIFNFSSNTNF
ncbi:MAG: MBL fold metallo-hydrolase [Candidatus Hodarchaeota archaeon]